MAKKKIPDDVRQMTVGQLQQELSSARDASWATELALLIRECPDGESLLRQITVLILRMSDLRSQLQSLEVPDPAKVAAERARLQKLIDFHTEKAAKATNLTLRHHYEQAAKAQTDNLALAGLPPDMTAFVSHYKRRQADLQALAAEWEAQLPSVDLKKLMPDIVPHLEAAS